LRRDRANAQNREEDGEEETRDYRVPPITGDGLAAAVDRADEIMNGAPPRRMR